MAVHFRNGLRGEDMRLIRRELARTRRAMWAETLVHAFWPAVAVLCFGMALALLGGFSAFGPLAHRVLLGLFALACAGTLVWGGMRLKRPDTEEIEARLDESDPRRPLATLRDELAVGRGEDRSETVWQAHRSRTRAALANLVARWPNLRVSAEDPWAFRLVAPVLLAAGLIAAGTDLPERLSAVTDPAPLDGSQQAATFARDPAAEAWATPPAYTGHGTIYLDAKGPAAGPIVIPQGSDLTIRVTDAPSLPVLEGGALAGIGSFNSLGGGLAEAVGIISASGVIRVLHGSDVLAEWQIEMTPDSPPEIDFEGVPLTTLTRAVDVRFTARDDYGVIAAWAEIAPEGHDPENARGLPLPVIEFGLPLPLSGDSTEVQESAIRDLTAHPWAGAEVLIQLYAEDGAEQVGTSRAIRMVLPERRFTHPLARALVEQRRELALDYDQSYRVLDVLQAVTRRPHELFDNPGVFLTIRSAIRRLAHGVGTETVPEVAPNVIELLWQAALGLEDGDLSSALERLRQAQEALRQALENGTDEDIRRAMEELRAALNEYLQQLAQQQQRNPQQQQQGRMDPNQMLSQQDLQEMLDRMQRQAESGMREQARDMLSELNRMLENLQAMQQQQMQSPGQQALEQLQDMIQRQRDLSDRTFDELRQRQREQQLGKQGQQGQRGRQGQMPGQQQPGWGDGQGRGDEHGRRGGRGEGEMGEDDMQGGQGQPGAGGLARQQEALRRELENLARGLGSEEAARALEEAVRSMGEARDDLERGENSDAVRDQMDALDNLNEGAEALAEEVQNGQGQADARGNRRGRGRGEDSLTEDPFDRPSASYGSIDGRATRVPDQSVIDRARELMQELRRRAAEPSRPELELDYLDRLLERF